MNGAIAVRLSASLIALPACFLVACVDAATGDEPAASGPEVAAVEGPQGAQHCVVSPSSQVTCYDTFTAAIAAATNGEIADAPADPRLAIDDDAFTTRINAIGDRVRANAAGIGEKANKAVVVIGISYKDAHYNTGGGTWVWEKPWGCDGNLASSDWWVENLNVPPFSDFGFNDSISSFHSYNNCRTQLFEDWRFLGSRTPLTGDMDYVGDAMNDRASSIAWY